MKAKQILFSFFALGIFWWMATATSESPSWNEIRIINKTGYPVQIIERCGPLQDILNVQRDSIIFFEQADTCSGDSAICYYFFSQDLFKQKEPYPGFFTCKQVKINCDSLKARYYDYDPLLNWKPVITDSFYIQHPQYRQKIQTRTQGGITEIEYWLPPDSTRFATTPIPLDKKYRGPNDYQQYGSTVFTIFYINRYGHRCLRKVGGKRFYKNLRKDKVYVIE